MIIVRDRRFGRKIKRIPRGVSLDSAAHHGKSLLSTERRRDCQNVHYIVSVNCCLKCQQSTATPG